jgi:putative transposase
MKNIFVRDHRGAFPVSSMCPILGVDSSGFYAWLKPPESPRSRQNRRLLRNQNGLSENPEDL